MNQVSKEQIQEWIEHPITERLAELVGKELTEIRDTPVTEALCYGRPELSHENLLNLQAREMVWEDLTALLSGDWSYFEEDEDE